MEKRIVVTKRFRRNTLHVYEYILKEFSAKTAFEFLNKLEDRIELIIRYPEIGKPSLKISNVRSLILSPHNRIYYRLNGDIIELLCLFDMRKNDISNPYR